MSRPHKRRLNQKAVLWERTGFDEDGQPKVASPVQIDVKWEENRSESIDDNGTPIAIDGTVLVNQSVEKGSILWRGELIDLPSSFTDDLLEVVGSDRIPDLKGRKNFRSLSIRKWRGTLPTVG